jgi:hypothetical protein
MIDQLKQHPYINPDIFIEKHNHPFKYYVLKDVFKENIYESIIRDCDLSTKHTPVYGEIAGSTSNYGGRLQNIPNDSLGIGSDFFVSDIWKNFNMQIFNLMLNNYIALSFHVHDAPAKKGFTHTDFNICSFSKKPDDKDYQLINGNYASDANDSFVKVMRSVAFLYYFNNDSVLLDNGDGGTDIFDHNAKYYSTVNATNNSLLCFEVTPESYHSFAGSTYQRSAIVGWLHSTPVKAIHKNIDLVRKHYKKHGVFSEKWPNDGYWNIQNDPEFYEYFRDQTEKILEEFNIVSQTPPKIPQKRILVIGGTQMFGRAFVEQLLNKDWHYHITLANRGITNPNLFSTLEHIEIDRSNHEGCKKLNNNIEYDVVVDFSCYNVDNLKAVIENIKYKKYIFISTISAQANFLESCGKDYRYRQYALDKRATEEYIVKNHLPMMIYRAVALYGENDYTDRFEKKNDKFYWKNSDNCVSDDTSGMFMDVNDAANIVLALLKQCI